jgi:hypothetical protein
LQAFEKLLTQAESRLLVLLALHALGDICAGLPKPKPPMSKAARLLMLLETPAEESETPAGLSPKLGRALLEKTLTNPDPQVNQARQILKG